MNPYAGKQLAALREKYEWCNIWWDEADETDLPRILLIGDSITAGYRPPVQARLQGIAHVDQLAASFAITDPALLFHIERMLGEYPYEVIHFNNGLHGGHLSADEYETALGYAADLIARLQPGAGLALATSTPVTEPGKPGTLSADINPIVEERNGAVERIAAGRGLPIDDLYALVSHQPEIRSADGYHYKPEGLELLANQAAGLMVRMLRNRREP